jgi:hypothetical protein
MSEQNQKIHSLAAKPHRNRTGKNSRPGAISADLPIAFPGHSILSRNLEPE